VQGVARGDTEDGQRGQERRGDPLGDRRDRHEHEQRGEAGQTRTDLGAGDSELEQEVPGEEQGGAEQ
jgi:hypothetical protein